jgi:hypothetical protein
VRHSTLRIVFRNLLKLFLRFLILERVQQRDAPFEGLLLCCCARYREVHCAQLILRQIFVMMAFVGERPEGKQYEHRESQRN